MSTDATSYDSGSTFAMRGHVYSTSNAIDFPQPPPFIGRTTVEQWGKPGIHVPSWPVVRRVSNIPRTLSTRSENPGSPAMSSATRSSE